MNKYFVFKASNVLDKTLFSELINAFFAENIELVFESKTSGYIYASDELGFVLGEIVNIISNDLALKISFLSSHTLGEMTTLALNKAYNIGQSYGTLGQFVLKLYLDNPVLVRKLLEREFSRVSHELILTASAYLRSDMNAVKASKLIYVHRNTFNYRLQKFINITNLDVRDYANAFYFQLYLSII